MAPENQGFAAFRGPVAGAAVLDEQAVPLDINRAYRMGRGIKAGRVWTNCYHLYPAHAAFGGYKKSGVGRETHKMML